MTGFQRSTACFAFAGLLALSLAVGGCAPTLKTHGHNLDVYEFERVQPGSSSREDVLRILGSPSATSVFDNGGERWYYVSQQKQEASFYQSEIIKQDVVLIEFDDKRIVSRVADHGLEQALKIEPNSDETQSLGNELTLVQQLLGNVGRFNSQNTGAFSNQGSAARR